MKARIYLIFLFSLLSLNPLQAQQHIDGLKESLETAAIHNAQINAAYHKVEARFQKVPQLGVLPDPTVGLGFFLSPVETRLGPQQFKLSINQMLPWFGSLAPQKDQASEQAKAEYQRYLDIRNKVFQAISQNYFELYNIQKQRDLAQKNLRIYDELTKLITQKYEDDTRSLVDILQVDIQRNEVVNELEQLEYKEATVRSELNYLIGVDALHIQVTDSLISPLADSPVHIASTDSLIQQNPQIEAINHQIQSTEDAAVVVKKQSAPKIGVGFDYVFVGKRSDMAVANNGQDVIMPMLNVSIPILHKKKYQAALDEVNQLKRAFEYNKRDLQNKLHSQIEQVLSEIKQQQAFTKLYTKQLQQTELSLNLLLASYTNGKTDIENYLSMQQKQLVFERKQLQSVVNYHKAKAAYLYLTANYHIQTEITQ